MQISEQRRQDLLLKTRPAAAAFVEDMTHFRDLLGQRDPARGNLRRLSGPLRRLLIDGDIQKVSSPRMQKKLMICAPDNKIYYDLSTIYPCLFFASGGVYTLGLFMRGLAIFGRGPSREDLNIGDFTTQNIPLWSFIQQRVFCFHKIWSSRAHVIKYVANIASGVHSGIPGDDNFKDLNDISHLFTYSYRMRNGKRIPAINYVVEDVIQRNATHNYSEDAVNPVLIELLATCHYLSVSDDIIKLESIIQSELTSP